VLPHHPALEQQLPKAEPWHVAPPLVLPQVASVLTFLVPVADAADEVELDVLYPMGSWR